MAHQSVERHLARLDDDLCRLLRVRVAAGPAGVELLIEGLGWR